MYRLVSIGKLTPEKALRIAQDIQAKNRYIKPIVIENFKTKLGL